MYWGRALRRWRELLAGGLLVLLAPAMVGCGGSDAAANTLKKTAVSKPVARQMRVNAQQVALRGYARAILPVLHKSVPAFDGAARAASQGYGDAADQACSTFAARIDLLEGQADGVPHPHMWYTPVGYLHHRIMGVYHYMRGSLQACEDAALAGDDLSTSMSDIASATQAMHKLTGDVWWTGYGHKRK